MPATKFRTENESKGRLTASSISQEKKINPCGICTGQCETRRLYNPEAEKLGKNREISILASGGGGVGRYGLFTGGPRRARTEDYQEEKNMFTLITIWEKKPTCSDRGLKGEGDTATISLKVGRGIRRKKGIRCTPIDILRISGMKGKGECVRPRIEGVWTVLF